MAEWIQCDGPRCPARSFIHATFASGLSLHFCSHHGNEYMAGLLEYDAVIEDDRKAQATDPAPASTTQGAFV